MALSGHSEAGDECRDAASPIPSKRLQVVSRYPIVVRAAFSASHATLDPDRACNAAQDGTLWLSKAAIRPTQMMKAGDTFLCVRCVMFSSSVPGTITTA
jgi:hypothetical protein